MNVSPNVLWDKCLALIRENLSEQQFNAWFKGIVFESFNEETKTVLLRVPSPFVYEYLEENYVDLLRKVLTRNFGQGINLSYRIVTDNENKKTQTIESDEPTDEALKPRQREGVNQAPTMLDASPVQQIDSQLNPHLTFNNYIEGNSNKLTRSIGLSISEHPQMTSFNPFFVFGPSGCGKTHLINAMGVETKRMYPEKRVLYISARLFEVQYTNAVLRNTINDFINFYQTIDVLIVDDVQEWEGKTGTQNTFFHIFNHLHINGKQIILSADRPPIAIQGLEDRLLTRFKWGMQAEIEKPTQNMRLGILSAKVDKEGLKIPSNVLRYISENVNDSVRDLEGIINSLMAYSVVYNCNINMNLVQKIMPRFVVREERAITIDDVKQCVCNMYNLKISQLDSRTRTQQIAKARQIAMYLASELTGKSHVQVGVNIGNRNHATVIHAIKQVKDMMDVDETTRQEIEELTSMLKTQR